MENSVSLRQFISAYPYPAFLLSAKSSPYAAGNLGSSLSPVFSNSPFRRLMIGAETSSDALLTSAFMGALGSLDAAKKFTWWLTQSSVQPDQDSAGLVLDFVPSWASPSLIPVKLHLVKTSCGDYWAITSLPLSPLPQIPEPAHIENTPHIKRFATENMHLTDLPSPAQFLTSSTVTPASTTVGTPGERYLAFVPSSPPPFEPVPSRYEEMARLMAEYPWETTVVGPRESWPDSMKTIRASLIPSGSSIVCSTSN